MNNVGFSFDTQRWPVVYRAARMLGIPGGKSVAQAFKKGERFLHAAPFSSTTNLRVAKSFGGGKKDTLLIIHVKELSYTADLLHNTNFPTEDEVLWYPYTGFQVEEYMEFETARLDGVWRYVLILSTIDTHKICKKGSFQLGSWESAGMKAGVAITVRPCSGGCGPGIVM